MDIKLTLKLDQSIIEKAKEYASDKKISLSRIIENYLASLVSDDEISVFEISPFVKSISTQSNIIPNDLDYKSEYSSLILDKYK